MMKSTLTSFLLFFALGAALSAQPQIAYILPDIGAPGMNSYVEIVAPTAATGTFGGNGQYINSNNGSETVGIGPANIADTARIVVGPLVVSWNARLISTQIFVKPGAATGVVPLRVTVSGQSATVNFEIVTPQVLGAGGVITGGGVLGSGGTFGTRSKRGAMIVDQLILDGGVYTVSTADPDAATPGNQGYLPFVLISKKTLALVNNASVNVNGGTANGGPGGGGGGGHYCDKTLVGGDAGPGGNGGDGFTGGGAGGHNVTSGGSSSYLAVGNSSGTPTGTSLNGVGPGGHLDCNKYESAGGGTGHPFGTSGFGPCFPIASRQNGGGSAADQNTGGGGGGYGTNGTDGTGGTPGPNGGVAHGNKQGVPVAGGSGGGSGNPQGFPPRCSGDGGGGGGALVMYSQTIFNNTGNPLGSKGGNGGGGAGTSNGGSGSGGYIGVGAKIQSGTGGSGDVSGGPAVNGGGGGGNGRARYDGFTALAPTFIGQAAPYIGPTIDTLSYVQTRTFTITGTKGTDAIQVFMRSETGVWTQQPAPTVNGRLWSLQVTVPSGGNYYVCAMQVVNSPSTVAYQNEPGWVMSQAAANIIKVDLIPQINVDSTRISFTDVICNETILDSLKIWNSGDDTLRVTPVFSSGANFTIVSPTGTLAIPPKPGDTMVVMKIRFHPTTAGTIVDTLTLQNNDPRPGKNPLKIVLIGRKMNVQPSLSKSLLDFGDVCKDSLSQVLSTFLNYTGDVPGSLKSITRLGTGATPFAITQPLAATLPLTIASGSSSEIKLTFHPTSTGAFADSFRVVAGPCDSPFILVVRGRGVSTSATVVPNPIDFGTVPVNLPATVPVTITNTGTVSFTLRAVIFRNTGVPLSNSITGLVGSALNVGQSASGTVTITPQAAGAITGEICFVLDGTCPDTLCVPIQGTCTAGRLVLSRTSISMIADSCTDTPPALMETVTLYNRGTGPVHIDGLSLQKNAVTATPDKSLPTDLAAGDSIVITIRWTPGTSGTDQLTIATQAPDPAQRSMTVDLVLRHELSKLEALQSGGGALPPLIDFGTVLSCIGAKTFVFVLHNAGTLTENVTASFTTGAAFTLAPGAPYAVNAGQDQSITITFSASAAGTYTDTLVLHGANCNREIRIPLVAQRSGITFAVSGISFGNTNVGQSRRGTATITNTSNTPNNVKLNVADASITPGGTPFALVTPVGLPKALAPNESATVDVTFTPGSETTFNAQICFHIDSPCDTTICVPLTGAGVQSSVFVREGSLSFGPKYVCETDSLPFEILNTANTLPLSVDSIRIIGADAASFLLLKPTGLPLSIPPKDSALGLVRFTPIPGESTGLKNATLEIYTSDIAQPVVAVALIGERRKQSLATPTQLSFGRVEVGTTSDLTLTLENRTQAPLNITSFDLGAPYTVVSPQPPISVSPMDSIHLVIRFTPTDSLPAPTTLIVRESFPCTDSTLIPIDGQGKITPVGGATIAIDATLTGKPGDRIAIPILLRQAQFLNASGATTFQARLRFHKSLLLPIRARAKGEAFTSTVAGNVASGGKIVASTIQGRDRVVTVEITNNPMLNAAPDTLGFLDASVMLGDTTVTPILFDTVNWLDGKVVTLTTDGMFTLDGYCTVGGGRLLSIGTGFGIKTAAPNPFNPSTEIIFQTLEAGPTSLVIYDLLGRPVTIMKDRANLEPGTHRETWDASAFPSGVYMAVLTSLTQRSVYQLVLAK
ncbi:MAG: choice-of-anchor D domain-containing protein [Bacteroidetes bacterium]|nr:choice-of-anchor D domain-containing protein [Bacteroidota bacterium]